MRDKDKQEAEIHGKFVGRLYERPKTAGPKKYGFAFLALALDGSGVEGVSEVHVLLDPKVLERPETSKEALNWEVGDLIQLEGEVVKDRNVRMLRQSVAMR